MSEMDSPRSLTWLNVDLTVTNLQLRTYACIQTSTYCTVMCKVHVDNNIIFLLHGIM